MKAQILFAAAALLASPSTFAKPPADLCLSNGPISVCSVYAMGDSYMLNYGGYLRESSSIVYFDGFVNGKRIGQHVAFGGEGRVSVSGFLGAGHQVTQIELYFYDDQGRYDSRFGDNYRFEFQY